MPGRPKKPTAVKRAQGTSRKCREVDNEMVPARVDGLPSPPEVLAKNKKAMQLWVESVRELDSLDMLHTVDLPNLAAYCLEMANYFKMTAFCEKNGYTNQGRRRPEDIIRRDSLDRANRIAQQFGFVPAARTKISMGGSDKDDFFDE